MSRRVDNSKAVGKPKPVVKFSRHSGKKGNEYEDSERIKGIQDIFNLFDKNGNGQISAEEISSLMIAIGRNPNQEEIQKFLREVDKDQNGEVNLKELMTLIDKEEKVPRTKQEEIVDAFRVFDIDNNGYITYDEFKTILTKFGGEFTEKDVKEIYKFCDTDADGKLTYAEFVEMWKYQ